MKTQIRLIGLLAFVACAPRLCTAREFGPEWTRVRGPNDEIVGYNKELKLAAAHFGFGAANYHLQLESDLLHIVEFDDNQGFSVRWQQFGHIDVRKKRDGTPAWNEIRFPKVRYLDLNGDGILDVMMDHRKVENGQISILVGNSFVPVEGISRGWSATVREARSTDGTLYTFEDDKWNSSK